MEGYLQYARDWGITRDAIVRLSARLGAPFTYTELAAEIEDHDGLKIDPRGYAGALDAVASRLSKSDPLWTVMVVNAGSREPGHGFWQAGYADLRYREALNLSPERKERWYRAQQDWCVSKARTIVSPLDADAIDVEAAARVRADESLIDLMLEENRERRSD